MKSCDQTHDPARRSWVESANGHPDFPIQNLPFGIFAPAGGAPRAGVAIGDQILDLAAAARLLPAKVRPAIAGVTLNALLALPTETRSELRMRLSELLSDHRYRTEVEPFLHDAARATLLLPCAIGDYTDFYVGIHHAANIGRQFRPENPLLPNYKYVPIGYHGRASSIRPSGVDVVRPKGQRKAPDEAVPAFGPTRRLDYELELGIWIGEGNELGSPIPIDQAARHIGGFCLLNDWSARDIQAWEYQPLGPFLAKNFHSTISPWVVTSEAMTPFWRPQPRRPEGDPPPLPYLFDEQDQQHGALSIMLEVTLATQAMRDRDMPAAVLSRGPASNMYWTAAQMIAHHTSNGCNLNPGDLLGTGTISGVDRSAFGSLMEISSGGTEPVDLPTGETRAFLEDGDEIMLQARAQADGYVPIGFGPCVAVIRTARP